MATVYIVTSGSYSDYKIVGIFSTREKANEYVESLRAQYKFSDMNDVQEYELDQPREMLPGAYQVVINDAGDVVNDPWWSESNHPNEAALWSPYGVRGTRERTFYGYGLTVEHARRSAEELRRQTLALEGKAIAR